MPWRWIIRASATGRQDGQSAVLSYVPVVLGALALGVLCLSVLFGRYAHVVLAEHTESDQRWSSLAVAIAGLEEEVAEIVVPARSVFKSRDIAGERERLEALADEFAERYRSFVDDVRAIESDKHRWTIIASAANVRLSVSQLVALTRDVIDTYAVQGFGQADIKLHALGERLPEVLRSTDQVASKIAEVRAIRSERFLALSGQYEEYRLWLSFAFAPIIGGGAIYSFAAARQLRRLAARLQIANETERANAARFEDFAASVSDLFWESDAEHRYVYVSESIASYGVPAAHLIGQPLLDLPDREQATGEQVSQLRHILAAHQPIRTLIVPLWSPT